MEPAGSAEPGSRRPIVLDLALTNQIAPSRPRVTPDREPQLAVRPREDVGWKLKLSGGTRKSLDVAGGRIDPANAAVFQACEPDPTVRPLNDARWTVQLSGGIDENINPSPLDLFLHRAGRQG